MSRGQYSKDIADFDLHSLHNQWIWPPAPSTNHLSHYTLIDHGRMLSPIWFCQFFNLCNFNIPVSFESSHFSEKVFNCEPLKMCIFLTSSDDQSQSDDYQSQTFSQDQVVITWTRAITDIYVHGNNQGISFQLNKLLTFLNGIWHIFCWKYLDDLPKQITSIIIQYLNCRLSLL